MHKVFKGSNGLWGVEESGAVLYEPSFTRNTAKAIANMEDCETPPVDWEETRDRLNELGLPY
jgi:hypothetical protein